MASETPASVLSLLAERARTTPDSTAVCGPGRPELSYRGLFDHVSGAASTLRARGIAPSDRVALLVGGGAEAATAFLTLASVGSCAPLNPSYRRAELEFFLGDLGARALVVGAGLDTPARDVARARGIEVCELSVEPRSPAGSFVLDGAASVEPLTPPEREVEALVLHTSGTTARPKIVPLAHRHLLASARNVAATLGLEPHDRCLNVMPLFHIHGLVAGVLASMWAGSSVACTPGFHQLRFFDWLEELEPTWTTAVPTMHQSILERARRDPSVLGDHTLRLIRSSSSALPVSVLEGLEAAFSVPVVEAYGMTEAAHQMASNPVPGTRKPGSVGLPTGIEIAILDEAGAEVPPNDIGEVAIRGESVFSGYDASPEVNANAFVDGWFRTGDQGRLDEDGYLFLQGRLKEIINRAGEKISPLEVDEVLLRHPSVEQAVTFGMPHDRLGEEVAAAVVPREGATLDPREIQDFVAQVVAPFKVPRRIVVVDEIPKAATGKVQRVMLAERLDIATAHDDGAPRLHDEYLVECIRDIWSDVLEIPEIDPADDFFALGGDSILGTEAIARIRELIDRPDLPIVAIVRSPTPQAMAAEVTSHLASAGHGVVALSGANGLSRPLFFVHGVDGDVVRFVPLARLLSDRAAFGLRAPGHEPDTPPPSDIESLAEMYLADMRAVQDKGPYVIVSYCMGAEIALELAHRLEEGGDACALVLIDPRLRRPSGPRYRLWLLPRRARQGRLISAVTRRLKPSAPTSPDPALDRGPVWTALERAREEYVGKPTSAPTALLLGEDFERFEMPDWYIRSLFGQVVATENLPGAHMDLFRSPALASLHEAMSRALARFET